MNAATGLVVLWALIASALAPTSALAGDGLVVMSVRAGWPGADGGLQPGDRMLSASPASAPNSFALNDPWDWLLLQSRAALFGTTQIRGLRAGQPREWSLASGDWGVQVGYEHEQIDPDAGPAAAQPDCQATLANSAMPQPSRLQAWRLWRCALATAGRQDWMQAVRLRDQAMALLPAEIDPDIVFAALLHWTAEARRGGAVDAVQSSLESLTALLAAATHPNLQRVYEFERARLELRRSRFAQARDQSLALEQRLQTLEIQAGASHGVLRALNLQLLGQSLRDSGDLVGAGQALEQSLQIYQRVGSEGFIEAAGTRAVYGNLKRAQGDYQAAEQAFTDAVTVLRRVDPKGRQLALAQQNLSILYLDNGDLVAAEGLLSANQAIFAQIDPEGLSAAHNFSALAALATERAEFALAEQWVAQALQIFQARLPGGQELASVYSQAGMIKAAQQLYLAAERDLQQSVAIWQRLSAESLRHSWALQFLADIQLKLGNLDVAKEQLERVLLMRNKLAPGGLDQAKARVALAEVDLGLNRLSDAQAQLDLALPVYQRNVPDSGFRAQALNIAGRVASQAQLPERGLTLLCEAVEVLERQRVRVSLAAERRSRFAASQRSIYDDCIDAQMRAGQVRSALRTIEGSRARGMLEMLADRAIELDRNLRPELRARRDQLESALGQLQETLANQPVVHDSNEQLATIAQAQSALDEVVAQIRRSAPGYAALRYPQPLGVDQARAMLSPDMAALVYAIGEQRSWLIVLRAGLEPRNVPLAISRAELRELTMQLRQKMTAAGAVEALDLALEQAWSRLLAPAQSALAGTERWIIVPDGDLYLLPWAALRDDQGRYLIQQQALSVVASLSLLKHLRQPRADVAEGSPVLAVGDPLSGGAQQREALRGITLTEGASDGELPALPFSRLEADRVTQIYDRSAIPLLGARATEAVVRARAADADVVHLAVHGFFDPRRPNSSGLLLSPPGVAAGDALQTVVGQPPAGAVVSQDDGIVRVWEVFANWRLRADLVTLSACETALGELSPAEGLLGLTRAFQYAGARSVVSSLWLVADRSTAALMVDFHRYRRSGMDNDEALRRAQLDQLMGDAVAVEGLGNDRGVGGLIAGGRAALAPSHPAHWAGFVLHGVAQEQQ